jgi:TonB family protein
MRRLSLALSLLILSACSTPPPAPVAAPETPPPPMVIEEKVTGTVHVTASALNVRSEPSFEGEIIAQVKTGTELGVLRSDESWVKVRLASGETGWVASRFVSDDAPSSTTKKRAQAKRDGCPSDSDYAFIDAPTPSFSEDGPHGLVIVEATVNAQGIVTSAKLISNRTGDEALAFLAVREIKSARFSPPIMDCVPRAFIFTYRRTF